MKKFILSLTIVAALSGCAPSGPDKYDLMKKTPDITLIGVYEGCEVKYVDRGRSYDSFFMAKCGDTSTTTTETGGKHSSRITNITTKMSKADQERAEAERRAAEQKRLKDAALEKLTVEELKALLQSAGVVAMEEKN